MTFDKLTINLAGGFNGPKQVEAYIFHVEDHPIALHRSADDHGPKDHWYFTDFFSGLAINRAFRYQPRTRKEAVEMAMSRFDEKYGLPLLKERSARFPTLNAFPNGAIQ